MLKNPSSIVFGRRISVVISESKHSQAQLKTVSPAAFGRGLRHVHADRRQDAEIELQDVKSGEIGRFLSIMVGSSGPVSERGCWKCSELQRMG